MRMKSRMFDERRPLVTIVTPVYNGARYLAQAIESILAQTYPNIEYIVINDGSTDDTLEVARRYGDRLTIVDQANAGQAATLNRGWEMAEGELLTYLSSDDILYPNCIETLVEVLEAEPRTVCAFPNSDLISPTSHMLKAGVSFAFDREALVIEQECGIGPGAIFRAADFRRIGGWRTDYILSNDREFWIRLSKLGDFRFIDESLAGYRLHPKSISYSVVAEEISLEYVRSLDEIFSSPDVGPDLLARRDEAYARAYYLVARNCIRGGRVARGLQYLAKARRLWPAITTPQRMISLVKNVISKPLRMVQSRMVSSRHF